MSNSSRRHLETKLRRQGRAICFACDGTKTITCPQCNGEGREQVRGLILMMKCTRCGGSGDIVCPECSGEGSLPIDADGFREE